MVLTWWIVAFSPSDLNLVLTSPSLYCLYQIEQSFPSIHPSSERTRDSCQNRSTHYTYSLFMLQQMDRRHDSCGGGHFVCYPTMYLWHGAIASLRNKL